MRIPLVAMVAAVVLAVLGVAPAAAQQPTPTVILRGEPEPATPIDTDRVVVPVQVSPAPQGGTLTASTPEREVGPVPATTGDGSAVRIDLGPLPAGTHTVTVTFSGHGDLAPSETRFDVVVLSAEESFVRQAYRAVLNRAADRGGLDAWIAHLDAGLAPPAVALQMAGTPEARARVVTDLYFQVLDRAPDAAGRDHWVARLRAGLGTDEVLATLLASTEARAKGLDDPAALVDRLYRLHLDRDPDAGGAAYWEGRVAGSGPRATALAFARTRPVAAATVQRGGVAACASFAPSDATRSAIESTWARSGRDPGRLAALAVAYVCPRLP